MLAQSLQVIHRPEAVAAALRGTRRTLLTALTEPDSAAGLARRLGLPRQRLNYHLKALEQCGCSNASKSAARAIAPSVSCARPREPSSSAPTPLAPQHQPSIRPADRLSASYVVAVAARAISEVSALDARARAEDKRIATLTLDSEVRFASAEARTAFTNELTTTLAELVAKYHDESAPRGRRFRLVTIAHPTPTVDASPAVTVSPGTAAGEEQE